MIADQILAGKYFPATLLFDCYDALFLLFGWIVLDNVGPYLYLMVYMFESAVFRLMLCALGLEMFGYC